MLNDHAAYDNAHLVARDQVEGVREPLFDLPMPGNDEHPILCGHVGDFNHVIPIPLATVTFINTCP